MAVRVGLFLWASRTHSAPFPFPIHLAASRSCRSANPVVECRDSRRSIDLGSHLRSAAMFVCDICQRELTPGQSVPLGIEEVKRVIDNGFSPMRSDIKVYEGGVCTTSYREMVMKMAPDATVAELEEIWRRTALTETRGGWVLCPECATTLRHYR